MSLIKTDLQLFGFPVYFDWRIDRNVVELSHPNGDRVRMVIVPEPDQASNAEPSKKPEPA